MLLSPSLILSLLLGSVAGPAFFLFFGRKGAKMVNYWAVGLAAFLIGQLLAAYHPVSDMLLGEVHIVEAGLLSLFALLIAHWANI